MAMAGKPKEADQKTKTVSVELKSLHVMIEKDGKGWFAQGLEIDYAAFGHTKGKVMHNFAVGLALTLCEHLSMHGNIDKALVPAPLEAWSKYYHTPPEKLATLLSLSFTAPIDMFTEAGVSNPEEKAKKFPFSGIQYVESDEPAESEKASLAHC